MPSAVHRNISGRMQTAVENGVFPPARNPVSSETPGYTGSLKTAPFFTVIPFCGVYIPIAVRKPRTRSVYTGIYNYSLNFDVISRSTATDSLFICALSAISETVFSMVCTACAIVRALSCTCRDISARRSISLMITPAP